MASQPSTSPHLSNAAVNISALKEYASKELEKIIDNFSGTKALILDPSFIGPLNLISEAKAIKQHGVAEFSSLAFPTLPDELVQKCGSIIYICRPDPIYMKRIAEHILALPKGVEKSIGIIFTPRRTWKCEGILEEERVLREKSSTWNIDVKLGEFPVDLIPFESDVLSLEMKYGFKECFLEGDVTILHYVAKSIMRLQAMFGIIPNVKGKGAAAHRVFQLMRRMQAERGAVASKAANNTSIPEIDTLFIFDRSVDLVTPMMTPMTYEGLLDEIFEIKYGVIEVNAELLGDKKKGTKKLQLNSTDSLFEEIRDLNFRVLGPLLHKKAEFIKDTYSERHTAQTVNEMHQFMKKFKTAHQEHSYLQTHINLSQKISQVMKDKRLEKRIDMEKQMVLCSDQSLCEDYIEECIAKKEPLAAVYRLLFVLCLTVGIRSKKIDFFKREIIQTYGFEEFFTMNSFAKLGVLNPAPRKSDWIRIRKGLRLFTEKIDLQNPHDFNFTYSGYAPLSVRLLELASIPGAWKKNEDVIKEVPGIGFEYKQDLPYAAQEKAKLVGAEMKAFSSSSSSASKPEAATLDDGSSKKKPVTLVYFIGGVTFAEISAIRYLSEQKEHGRDYIIATTKIISGNSFIDSARETLVNNIATIH